MLLDGKTAVIYGGGGAIGGAVARTFAREGARVFVVGRTQEKLDAVAADIRATGGHADTAAFDALDAHAVEEHADAIAAETGSLDISFNLITFGEVMGTPMHEMDVDDYVGPIATKVRSSFLTWKAAARHMIPRGGGVILEFGGDGDPMRGYSLGSLQTTFTAVEFMRRQFATEVGEHGIRVVTLRTGGVADTLPADLGSADAITEGIVGATLLGRAATREDVANVAAFVASDRARTMTAATVNVSAGALID
jgi:NAD(P)-dependent dehydrogenase (short-subunit alcohol dehydrogenase family)